jgi:hypothetical protein
MSEYRTIRIQVYRDPEGRPTCASNFEDGSICSLLYESRFGTDLGCGALNKPLFHGDHEFITPLKECPVWLKPMGFDCDD